MGRRKRKSKHWRKRKPDTLVELILDENIYLVNYYGLVWKTTSWSDWVLDSLTRVGENVVGIMFGSCLVLLPADVAVKNLDYLRPVEVPRREPLRTRTGTRVYDLRKDLQGLYDGEWTQVNFDAAAREFWNVVGEHKYPWRDDYPLFKYLVLKTGVDLYEA